MLPRPYFGSNVSEKGHHFFQKPWILALAKLVETFIHVSMNDMPTIRSWGLLKFEKRGNNTMHTFFYSNISEFSVNLEGMLDEGS